MKKDILIIVPSRGRYVQHCTFIESYLATNPTRSHVLIGLDEDDEANYRRVIDPRVAYDVNPRLGCVGTQNLIADKYAGDYAIVGLMGDDSVFRSKDWEKQVLDAHDEGALVISPADQRMDDRLPAAYFVDSRIPAALGFLILPTLQHLCGDDFLLALGKALGAFRFLPDCLIEHMHYLVGKSEMDETYAQANSRTKLDHDCAAFDEYMETGFFPAVEEVKKSLGRTASRHKFSLQLKRATKTVVSPHGPNGHRKRMVKALFCTPFYHPTCTFSYMLSMMQEPSKLPGLGIEMGWTHTIGDVVHRQRNVLSAIFLSTDSDVLVFVDSDTGFVAEDVARMIHSDLPVVVANYPKRNYFFDAGANGEFKSGEELRNALLQGTVEPLRGARTVNGMTEVLFGGTGLMVIQRRVFTAMMTKGIVEKLNGRVIPNIRDLHYRFFGFEVSRAGHPYGAGEDMGEDYTFCDKVRRAGFGVWCDFDAKVTHDGLHAFEGTPRMLKKPLPVTDEFLRDAEKACTEPTTKRNNDGSPATASLSDER